MQYFVQTRQLLIAAANAATDPFTRQRWLDRAAILDAQLAAPAKDRRRHSAALRRSCADWRDRLANQ